jgi:predicted nucleic-acid-binding Zn-ribbon protein
VIKTPLTPEQKEKMITWLDSKNVNRTCSSCGCTDNWGWGDIISGNAIAADGRRASGINTQFMVQLVCMNCGYVRLYLVNKNMKFF